MSYQNIKINKVTYTDLVSSETSASIPLLAGTSGSYVKGFGATINVTVDTPAAATFDSGVASSLVEQDLTYTAVVRGSDGDDISIEYVAGGTAGAEVVTVIGNAISIEIEDGVSTATQVKAAYDAEPLAVALATVAISGTAGDAQVAVAPTNLAGGVDSEVDIDDNVLAIPAHDLPTGLKGQLTTTGTLPTGLSLLTDYYVIAVDANSIKLASSLVNAEAGTAINITSQGTSGAVHTFTPTALAGGTFKIQLSIDNENWVDLAAATNITASSSFFVDEVDPLYDYIKFVYTMTAGRMTIVENVIVKGE